MTYKNKKQYDRIDNDLFIIFCWEDETMKCSEEEFIEALKMAKSCMKFAMKAIATQDKSLKEMYQKMDNDEMIIPDR